MYMMLNMSDVVVVSSRWKSSILGQTDQQGVAGKSWMDQSAKDWPWVLCKGLGNDIDGSMVLIQSLAKPWLLSAYDVRVVHLMCQPENPNHARVVWSILFAGESQSYKCCGYIHTKKKSVCACISIAWVEAQICCWNWKVWVLCVYTPHPLLCPTGSN